MERWRFLDPDVAADASERARALAAIDQFWTTFAAHEREIASSFTGGGFDVAGFMRTHLVAVHPLLSWEFGPAGDAGHFLAITPEDRVVLTALAAAMIERAPRLHGWRFRVYRPRQPVRWAAAAVAGRVGGGIDGWAASVEHGTEYRLDVTFYVGRAEARDPKTQARAHVAVDVLVGERLAHEWIGMVHVKPRGLFGGGEPLAALAAAVDAKIAEIHGRLPDQPYWRSAHELHAARQNGMATFRADPPRAMDYAEQDDLRLGMTWISRGMWTCAHGRSPFFSTRFSRVGETFCYLKLDGCEREPMAVRPEEMRDRLDRALVAAGLGVSVGGGHGHRYAYLDLALVDVERSIGVIRAVLHEVRLTRRSWIQFYDLDLVREWIGVYPDGPPPPLRA